jgi:hypothetical protein
VFPAVALVETRAVSDDHNAASRVCDASNVKFALAAVLIVAATPPASVAATVTLMFLAPLIVSPDWNVLVAAPPLITPDTFPPFALIVSMLVVSELIHHK